MQLYIFFHLIQKNEIIKIDYLHLILLQEFHHKYQNSIFNNRFCLNFINLSNNNKKIILLLIVYVDGKIEHKDLYFYLFFIKINNNF